MADLGGSGVADLAGTRVLVTGASGFIGSHLTRRLVALGAEVHAVTSAVSSVFPTRLLDLNGRLVLHEANLCDRSAIGLVVRASQPEVVFHLGAYTHVGKSWARHEECVQVNVQGTANLLEAVAEVACRRVVNTGTSEVYGDVDVPFREDGPVNPISPYAVSKHAAEQWCRMQHHARGWPIVCARPFNAYGPAQSPDRIIPEVIVRALRGQRLPMTKGLQTREVNHVSDLVEGFLLLGTVPGLEGELVNLGCGQEISIAELTATILRLMGDPIAAELGALEERPAEIHRMVSDSSKAMDLLGWAPRTPLEDGLRTTIDWYAAELSRPASPFALGP